LIENYNSIPKDLRISNILSSRARIKILEILAFYNELNISEIIKQTKLNHSSVENHLKYLIKINFIQEKIFGRIKIYRFKDENINARALKNLINLWSSEQI
jgi:predicted transcriptional regulator